TVMQLDRGDGQVLALLGLGGLGNIGPKERQLLADLNWDPALRSANRMYDRLAAAMRGKERATREKILDEIEAELKELKAAFGNADDLSKLLLRAGKTPEARGKVVGELLVSLITPAVRKVQMARDRNEQIQSNLHLAFALAAYHRDHKRYPKV